MDEKDLNQFHVIDPATGKLSVDDYGILQWIKGNMNIFIMGQVPYIYEDGVYRADRAGTKLKTIICEMLYQKFRKAPTIKRVYDLILSDNYIQVTPGELNCYPAEWINFKNGFYDPLQKRLVPHDPKYRATVQVPHEYVPGIKGDAIREWLDFICENADDKEMLLEYAGLCMTRDVRQQKFMILNGEGGTGKSLVIRMIDQMVGAENISNISLHQLTQRFAAYGLLDKLLNSCADLETDALTDVSTLKKILGEDALSAEAKGKDAISFRSFAKLIFSTNELPLIKTEKTNGFYRRLLVLTMNRVPEERDPKFFDKLSADIGDFIQLSVQALERMYERKCIIESAGSIEAVKRLRCESDTVEAFLEAKIERVPDGPGARLRKSSLYADYEEFTRSNDGSPLPKGEFFRSIRMKGIGEVRTGGYDCFRGIKYLEKFPKKIPNEEKSEWMAAEGINIPF